MKKLMSFFLSLIIICGMNIMTASAVDFVNPIYEETESYKKQVEEWNKVATHSPELTELFSNFTNGNVVDMWVKDGNDSGIAYIIYQQHDVLVITLEEKDLVASDIKDYLTQKIKIDIEVNVDDSDVSIWFDGYDHELNYMLGEKVISVLSEKYNIESSVALFNRRYFGEYHISWASCDVNENNFGKYSAEQVYELNKVFEENGIKAKFDYDLKKIVFPNDITAKEHLEYAIFIKEKYNQIVSKMGLVNAPQGYSQELEINKDNLNYCEGDANCDKQMDMSDVVLIMQALANPNKYQLSAQGRFNADLDDKGITVGDAHAIQRKLLGFE